MSALPDLSPGALFAGQFRIVRPLARGGMGAVYVVEQLATARERALKLMHPLLASDARSVERFTREAQVASRIESDHVVEVVLAGVDQRTTTPWLCMELLHGETLAERIERSGRLPVALALEVVKQLGHALTAAHRAGIVHRDLKPENIFLATPRREGIPFTLKVLDFGVAALVHEASGGANAKTTQGVGSPMWMAPEQTSVGRVSCATDVWALGLIAFYLLTGKSYWKAPTMEGAPLTALLVEIMVEPLVPASLRAAEQLAGGLLPPGFDGWFSRTVARDPGHRYPEAGAAIQDLVAVLEASERGEAPPVIHGASAAAAFAETGVMGSIAPAMPATHVSPHPAPAHIPRAVEAPKRRPRRWPLVLATVLGLLLLVGGLGAYAALRAVETAAGRLGTFAPHVRVDGQDIELDRDGVELHTKAGRSIRVTRDGVVLGESADEDLGATETVNGDEALGAHPEEGARPEESGDETVRHPRASRPLAPHRGSASAGAAAARRSVIDPCWRGTFEGETPPPSARWTFDFQLDASNTATNVTVHGPTGRPYVSFVRCVTMRVGQFVSPDGTDHVAVVLP